MYKTKVQELCQRRSWTLPDYQTFRDGPAHNPRYTSTVTVNGLQFQTPQPTRSSKEAQNNAAKLAFNHFSQPNSSDPNPYPYPHPHPSPSFSLSDRFVSATPSSSGSSGPNNGGVGSGVSQPRLVGCQTSQSSSTVPATATVDDQKKMLHLYKNKLQNYAHKRNLTLPVYSSEFEGPPHALRFKCKVTIDGQTFESPKFFAKLKDAEHAAAEVALMLLSPTDVQEDQIGLYKNLLQELVQREGLRLPSYTSNRYGETHMPMFVSQVEIEGESFTGEAAKSKKQAETNAAKIAYVTLKDRKGASSHQAQAQVLVFSSERSEANNLTTGLQHHANLIVPESSGLVTQIQPYKDIEHIVTEKEGSTSSENTNGLLHC